MGKETMELFKENKHKPLMRDEIFNGVVTLFYFLICIFLLYLILDWLERAGLLS